MTVFGQSTWKSDQNSGGICLHPEFRMLEYGSKNETRFATKRKEFLPLILAKESLTFECSDVMITVSDESFIRRTTPIPRKGITMSESKKSRSPKLNSVNFIQGAATLRHTLERAFTVPELTTFLNTHYVDNDGLWMPNPEGTPNGLRNSLSIASKLSQTRAEIEEHEAELGKETVQQILNILEVSGTERAKPDLRSMVTNLKSLGILAAPANMVRNSGHIGTNGQPVGNVFVEA